MARLDARRRWRGSILPLNDEEMTPECVFEFFSICLGVITKYDAMEVERLKTKEEGFLYACLLTFFLEDSVLEIIVHLFQNRAMSVVERLLFLYPMECESQKTLAGFCVTMERYQRPSKMSYDYFTPAVPSCKDYIGSQGIDVENHQFRLLVLIQVGISGIF